MVVFVRFDRWPSWLAACVQTISEDSKIARTLALLKLSEKLKLPMATLNQARAFFLRQIPHWEEKLILCAEGKKCRIYRPNGTLFIQLKIRRMSESDLQDCLEMISYCKKENEILDVALLKKDIQTALKKAEEECALRLQSLNKNISKLHF